MHRPHHRGTQTCATPGISGSNAALVHCAPAGGSSSGIGSIGDTLAARMLFGCGGGSDQGQRKRSGEISETRLSWRSTAVRGNGSCARIIETAKRALANQDRQGRRIDSWHG